jgi:hypothetical protein
LVYWIQAIRGLIILVAMLIDAQKVRVTSQAAPLAKIEVKTQASRVSPGD